MAVPAACHKHRFSDSRVHRCWREVGFLRANQSEIDSDPRSRQVYQIQVPEVARPAC